jgi:hypothetical protein
MTLVANQDVRLAIGLLMKPEIISATKRGDGRHVLAGSIARTRVSAVSSFPTWLHRLRERCEHGPNLLDHRVGAASSKSSPDKSTSAVCL